MTTRQTKNWYYLKLDYEENHLRHEIKKLGKGNWFWQPKTKEWGVKKTAAGIALINKLQDTQERIEANKLSGVTKEQKKYWGLNEDN